MFFEQLLRAQIPKAPKDIDDSRLFALLGFAHIKASSKHVDETNTSSQKFGFVKEDEMTFSELYSL